MALSISVVVWQLDAKFLLPRGSQLLEPVGVGREIVLDGGPLQAVPAQFRSHAKRPLASGGMIGDEILHVAPIVEQLFGAQRIEQERHDAGIESLLQEFKAQILRCVVAPRQRVERESPGGACVVGFDG